MSASPERPRSISLVLWMLILFGCVQGATVVALSKQSALLLDLSVRPDPRLRLLIAAIWMALFWVAALCLWRKKKMIRWFVPLLVALYAIYEVVVLAGFTQVPISGQSWTLYGLGAVSAVLLTYWGLNRKLARIYLSEEGLVEGQ